MCKQLIIDNYTIKTSLYDILYALKKESHLKYLKHIVYNGEDPKYIMVTCPFHKEGQEDKPSCGVFAFNEDNKYEFGHFNCLACGKSGSLIQFVSKCLSLDISRAKKWLVDNFKDSKVSNANFSNINLELSAPIPSFYSLNKTKSLHKYSQYLNENILNSFQNFHPYMLERKLSLSVIRKFKIKYDSKTDSIVFPVYDLNNKLIMLTRREIHNKKYFLDKGINKVVYLLNYIVNNNIPYTIICESQINALYCHSLGLSAVATFGCKVTSSQIDDLNNSNIHHFIIAFDGDEAGREGAKKLYSRLNPDKIIDILNIPNGKDINDLNKEEIKEILKNSNLDYNNLTTKYLNCFTTNNI